MAAGLAYGQGRRPQFCLILHSNASFSGATMTLEQRIRSFIFTWAAATLVGYFAVGMLGVCERVANPATFLAPIALVIVTYGYVMMRDCDRATTIVAAALVGAVLGTVGGYMAPWTCF